MDQCKGFTIGARREDSDSLLCISSAVPLRLTKMMMIPWIRLGMMTNSSNSICRNRRGKKTSHRLSRNPACPKQNLRDFACRPASASHPPLIPASAIKKPSSRCSPEGGSCSFVTECSIEPPVEDGQRQWTSYHYRTSRNQRPGHRYHLI